MNLIISASPHITSGVTTQKIMRDVLIALCPALLASVLIFGWRALLVCAVCVAACVFFEWGFERLARRESTISDLSAAVTGLILAFNLPVSIPLWQAVFGALVAIVATIIPPFVIITVISYFYELFRDNFIVSKLLAGMQAGVGAVIASVVWDMGGGILKQKSAVSDFIMLAAFLAACVFRVNVVYIILACIALGVLRTVLAKRRKGA